MRFLDCKKVFFFFRNNHLYPILILLMIGALFTRCDSTDDVKPYQGKTFIKLFGGNGTEEGKDLTLLPDQGFVMVGSSTSNSLGGKDVYVVRTDKIGNVLWEARYGGIGDDVGNSVIVGSDNNIYVCGEITQENSSNTELRDTYVLSLSADGSLLGEHIYGDSLRDEFGTDIYDITDAGFLITSTWLVSDTSKYFIVETDNNLSAIDKRSRYIAGSDGVGNLSTKAFERTDPSPLEPPFICFGSGQDQLNENSKVFKFQSFYYRANVNDAVDEDLYGFDDSDSFCTDVEITADGGYVMSGYNRAGSSIREMVVKISPRREEVWKRVYVNEFGKNIKKTGITQTNDGGYVVVSTIELEDPLNDEISLIKLNSEGEESWRKNYGSNDDDIGSRVIELDDGSFVFVGTVGFEINPDSRSKMCLIKINPNGELVPL